MILLLLSLSLFQGDPGFGGRLGGKRNLVARGGGGADTEDAVLAGLKWLSRHQQDDGTWNAAKIADRCGRMAKYGDAKCAHDTAPPPAEKREEKPLTAEETAKLDALVGKLAGSIEERDAAARALAELDARALDPLRRKAAAEKDAEVKARLQSAIDAIAARDGPDGDVLGSTALVLLAYLGAGYTPVSLDTFDGICFGGLMESGFAALLKAQGKDGFVGAKDRPRSVRFHALATQVLAEAAGLLRDKELGEKAQAAVTALIAQQRDDGSFPGSPGKDRDAVATLAAAWALHAARVVRLDTGKALQKLAAWVPAEAPTDRGELAAAATCALVARTDTVAKLAEAVRTAGLSADDAPLVTMALTQVVFHTDGPDGRDWKAWNEKLKELGVKTQAGRQSGCASGSWTPPESARDLGRVGAAACWTLTMETYYRFEVIAPKK